MIPYLTILRVERVGRNFGSAVVSLSGTRRTGT
jgi:hypothetical protein